jgi:acid phosphatase (class A)
MKTRKLTFFNAALACVILLSLFSGYSIVHHVIAPALSRVAAVSENRSGLLVGYLENKDYLNCITLIPIPPASGSAAVALDEDVSRGTFALRGTPRFALALSDYDLAFPHAASTFSCALKAPVTEQDTPHLYMLLRRTMLDAGLSTDTAKSHYKRQRPFVLNKEPICAPEKKAELEKNGSYPSGHAAIGWAWALILTEISPEHANAILARGRAFGESRIVCNHHWYSDVEWGRFIGAAVVARLHANPAFLTDLKAAKTELTAVHNKGLNPTRDCRAEAAALDLHPY